MPEQKLLPIDLENLGRFSVGERDKSLYLDGDKVQTAAISLTRRQAKFAIAAALATIVGALASAAYTVVYIWTAVHKTPTVTNLVTTGTTSPIHLVMVGCVGPFASGKSDVLEEAKEREPDQAECGGVDIIKRSIVKETTSPLVIAVVGAADKFDPSPSVRHIYGSNDGLAQARAEWVVHELGFKGSVDNDGKIPVVSLVRGPIIHGIDVTNGQSTRDRTVAVYGLWPSESPSSSAR
jgi:hypothetical protein